MSGASDLARLTETIDRANELLLSDKIKIMDVGDGVMRPTNAKVIADLSAQVNTAIIDFGEQMTDGKIYSSEALGRASVADGVLFYAVSTDPLISKTLWQRVDANTSLHIVDTPSSGAISAVQQDVSEGLTSVREEISGVEFSATGAQAFAQIADDQATDREFTYYIDSVIGSDSNPGTSKMLAFASFAPVLSLLTAGIRVGLARGSVFREELTSSLDKITLSAYGMGNAPIIDASDAIVASAWTKTTGRSNVYEVPISLPGDVKISGNVYADGVALTIVLSAAICDSTPGSAYIASWSSASTTLYLNPPGSTDPRIDGREYRYTRRASSIFLSGSDCIVRGIVGRRNGHQDGSIRLTGNRAMIQHAQADDGCRHSMIVSSGCLLENLVFRRGRNSLEVTANTLVVNQPVVVGTRYRTRRCTFDAGGYAGVTGVQNHGANTHDLFDQVVHEDPTFIGLSQSVDVAAVDTQIVRPVFVNTVLGAFFGRNYATGTLLEGTGTLTRAYSAEAPCTFISKKNVLTVPLLANGFYKSEAIVDVTAHLDGDKITVLSGTPPSANFIRHAKGVLDIKNSDFGPALGFPANSFLNAGYSGGTVSYTGDYNSFPYGATFTLNGVTYNTLAEWQAATGQDAHSVTKQPIPTFSDNFNRADELLEANTNWKRIGGAAGMAGVRSNQLAILGATQTLYAAPALGSPDQFVKFAVAAVPASSNSFVVLRAVDQNNWLGIRWNATQWMVYRCVAGVLAQVSTSSVIAPAVGQEVVLAVRGTYFCFYVNGRVLGVLQAIGSTVLDGNVLAGIVTRGAAQNPLIDNFSCGLA